MAVEISDKLVGRARLASHGIAIAAVLPLFLGLCGMAQAQVAQQYWECRAPSSGVEAGWCPSSTANPLPVTGTFTPSATQDVNQKQVNGATINVGAGAAGTGTQRVTTSTDSTIGTVTTVTSATVIQPTAANLNATVVGTGTLAVQASQVPSSASTAGVASVQSTAVETGHVIKASAGNLYSFNVSADSTLSAVAWAVQIFNSTTVPAAGAVTPTKCYLAPIGTTSLSGDFAVPLYMGTGVSIAVSTGQTCFTKTDSAHGFISANVQ